jgi:hypothetical protein
VSIFIVLFTFVLGLLAGGVGAIWLVAPLVGREEAHRALAWYVARRHIEDIQAEALARMASLVEAARQPSSTRSVRPAVAASNEGLIGRDFSEAKRLADQATRTPR